MRIVVALGGNALLQRGEPLTVEAQRRNARLAASSIAMIAAGNELIVTHGNGPQIGLLAMQTAAGAARAPWPLDILGAETDGMIGYVLEQELRNAIGTSRIATLLTQTRVDPADPAFALPSKFVGQVYGQEEAQRLAAANNWWVARDGAHWRRVVASPEPQDILEIDAIRQLAGAGFVTICAGGGGIPVARSVDGRFEGMECVVDKDYTSALLADLLGADCLLLLTDVPAVQREFGTVQASQIRHAHPAELQRLSFPAGSMGPKVTAACRFAASGARRACIGRLDDVRGILDGTAGTTVTGGSEGMVQTALEQRRASAR
jgi:carbamate kinase